MSTSSRQHEELMRCVARNLAYFEWIDANKSGYFDYQHYRQANGEDRSIERLNTDPLLHAKVRAIVQDIEFVLIDPISAERRRLEDSLRYARLIDGFPRE